MSVRYGRGRRRPMRHWRRFGDWAGAAALLALLVLAAGLLGQGMVREVSGQATVADGDSLTLAGERFRIAGIDAPEYAQTCSRAGRAYACGRRARQALAMLAEGRAVTCRGHERDRYGRLVARCEAGGRDLGLAMVESGWAITYGDYQAAEAEARRARLGLWAGTFQRPQEWRAARQGSEEKRPDPVAWVLEVLRRLIRQHWSPEEREGGGDEAL